MYLSVETNKGLKMRNEFQANAFFTVNDIEVKMISSAVTKTVTVQTKDLKSGVVIDKDTFSYEDPADISAAFAKYSNSITWAVTKEEIVDEAAVNGM
jgi:hypothetical protein